MLKVLVVDNNPVVLKFMETFLSKNGYQVKTAENGLVALDLIQNYTPDIFFVDLIMPFIRGELLVSILREKKELANSSIIILSGVAAEIVLDYISMGADACIAKGPFNSMGKHISYTLDEINKKGIKYQFEQVIGLEDVYKRSITKELMVANLHGEVILEGISDFIIEMSLDYRIVYVNTSALSFLNKSRQKIIAVNFLDIIDSTWKIKLISLLEDVKKGNIPKPLESILGEKMYIITAKYLNSSKDKTIVLIIRDITSQKMREEELKNKINEREMMIKEVYHRVKNNLAMVSSIINLQMGESDNAKELNSLNDLRSRIDSISMVHAKLFKGKDLNNINLDDYIRDLINNLIDNIVQNDTNVIADLSFPEVLIDFDKAVPLGIVLTELTTNALKYAFNSMDTGLISINYQKNEDGIKIIFSDNGKGLDSNFSIEDAESLGFNLIVSLVMQLEGSISVENNNGAVFSIILPHL
jgi:two-component sensor histidine kinase/CheY-like chemotaxis protein